jgi:DNA-binding IclR family transcriptional regulator
MRDDESLPLESVRVSTNPDTRSSSHVKSVDRAVDILEYLAQNGWSGVTDVGNALGVHKSTAFRVLATLEARGLVEQHADSGKYHLGFGLVHLARAVTVGPDLTRFARPVCQQLATETGETVTLAVLEGEAVVTIDQVIPDSSVVSQSWLGRRTPLHATSHGKVFLANLPQSVRATILDGPHEQFTERTLTDPVALYEELTRARERGYATCDEELEEGLDSAAAAVRGADGTVIASVGVSGPSYRINGGRLEELGEMTLAAAAEISRRFGFLGKR